MFCMYSYLVYIFAIFMLSCFIGYSILLFRGMWNIILMAWNVDLFESLIIYSLRLIYAVMYFEYLYGRYFIVYIVCFCFKSLSHVIYYLFRLLINSNIYTFCVLLISIYLHDH